MKKIILSLFAIGILFSINIAPVFACSCIPTVSTKESLEKSTAVFAGKVIDIDISNGIIISSADPVKITFDVSSVWKGLNYKTIIVETARSEASCGYSFEQGEEYLVYANGEESDLRVGLCGRTKLLIKAGEDLNELSEGVTPTIENHSVFYKSGLPKFIIFGILLSAVIIILVIIKNKRNKINP